MRPATFEQYVQLPGGVILVVVAVLLAGTWSDPVVGVLVGAAGIAAVGNALGRWSDGATFASVSLVVGGFAVWILVGDVPIDDLYAVVFGVLAVAAAVRAFLFYTGHLAPEPASPE